jgi:hypothetical protein
MMMELSDEQWFDLVHDANMVVVDDFDVKIRKMHGVVPDDIVVVFDSEVQRNLRKRPLIFDLATCLTLIRVLSASVEQLTTKPDVPD